MTSHDLQSQAVYTLRFLSADMVEQAHSGHPGLPMGAAAMAFTLWTRHLRHNPRNPRWPGRDRFILSGGHGSALLYSLLYLSGYDLSLDDLRAFRQWGSRTPGHPEYGLTPGVETTTGPLGQGFANGVGMAIAQAHLAALFNRPGYPLFDHYIYAIVTDGDLMEGVSAEAASLAGHLRLGKLIYLYDDNRISIDGSTDLTFSEDRARRFEAYGWQVLHVEDGNDVEAIDAALCAAQADDRPSLIVCRTIIGYGAPTRQGTAKAHGEPLGEEELRAAKEAVGWPLEKFYVPEEVLRFFRQAVERGARQEASWREMFEGYRREYPDLATELARRLEGRLPEAWDEALPVFAAEAKGPATRAASGKVLEALAQRVPELMGGSADLTPSNNTRPTFFTDFQKETPQGRYLRFGVREHAMGAILNGMALYGGVIPYGGTFLVFSDYMRPAIRLAALSHLGVIYVFTHDSIGLGEDGPTHQPVEHLAALRAIPNLAVIRPADANEVVYAWKVALEQRHTPTALVLSRQNLPVLDRSRYASAEGLLRGAYILADLGNGDPQIALMASGSEVALIVEAGERLAEAGYAVRLISFPSWELFEAQEEGYREQVLPPSLKARLAVEAGVRQGWERYLGEKGNMISLERFGASAPGKVLFEQFGFTVERVVTLAIETLQRIEQ
ncbi:MAG: transketolase [Anaerolineales bacterium]